MTTEEKARAYDEAIEKLRDFYRDYDTVSHLIDVKEELANLIPELRESEDERIRKELIEFVTIVADSKSNKMEWIAWLEKQGEQKSADSYCQENCKGFQETGKCFADGDCKAKIEAKETMYDKPKWSEKDEKFFTNICTILDADRNFMESAKRRCKDWLKSIKERVQPQTKQEWSESDKEEFQIAIDTLVEAGQHDSAHWLKSLKQRMEE